ncbi:Zinc resistance conferring protein [Coniosporium apollinis]|uniref:Zinc resistance conferring protein n=1 Tax=Coniosporium apollinis TaxID=61459 RepID=A0ABQ9P351_9PEZI|nr:Zinc resistance conferring protein [Coniosporium apollinis]
MGLSKSNRILILLAIDSAFFLLELVVGYAVHSLALVADSFHMLNDVLSLCVGLWAVKVANQKTKSKMYTYGWQRAETLGALVNGVFLVALCLSIFLEAIQRLIEPQEVSNPKLVLIVGCLGLASNIIGLFLFHEHGHSHGGGEHGHTHGEGATDDLSAAEEGHSHTRIGAAQDDVEAVADEGGNVADVLPESRFGNWPTTQKRRSSQPSGISWDVDGKPHKTTPGGRRERRHSRSRSRAYSNLEEIDVHPASFRNSIIAAARLEDTESGTDTEGENAVADEGSNPTENSPLLNGTKRRASTSKSSGKDGKTSNGKAISHAEHNHNQPKESGKGGHGHSHGDLNMRGVFLHVMGDALGNIGVIASALVIWLTPYWWRFYSDPLISLIITVIILCSAIPLCKAASRILLQAVPAGLSVDDIKEDIMELPGIASCHHLHVWQLSDTKLVASLHVQVAFDFKGEGSARYMELVRNIRQCLHEYGIHSSTIQPEFCLDESHDHSVAYDNSEDSCSENGGPKNGKRKTVSKQASKTGSLRDMPEECLLDCGDACGNGKQCCAPAESEGQGNESGNGKGAKK